MPGDALGSRPSISPATRTPGTSRLIATCTEQTAQISHFALAWSAASVSGCPASTAARRKSHSSRHHRCARPPHSCHIALATDTTAAGRLRRSSSDRRTAAHAHPAGLRVTTGRKRHTGNRPKRVDRLRNLPACQWPDRSRPAE